jgi:hypothetical protein
MLGSQMRELLLETARHLIDAGDGDGAPITGEAIAAEIGLRTDDPAVHDAFREIHQREDLDLGSWRGGPGLPAEVRLPWR